MDVYFCILKDNSIHYLNNSEYNELSFPEFMQSIPHDAIKVFFNVPLSLMRLKNVISLNMATKASHIECLFSQNGELPRLWMDWFLSQNTGDVAIEKTLLLFQKSWEAKQYTEEGITELISKTKSNPVDENRLPTDVKFKVSTLQKELKHKKNKWMAAAYCGNWLVENYENEFDIKRKEAVIKSVKYFHSHSRDLNNVIVEDLDDLLVKYLKNNPDASKTMHKSVDDKSKSRMLTLKSNLIKLDALITTHDKNKNCLIHIREMCKLFKEMLMSMSVVMTYESPMKPSEGIKLILSQFESNELIDKCSVAIPTKLSMFITKIEKKMAKCKKEFQYTKRLHSISEPKVTIGDDDK